MTFAATLKQYREKAGLSRRRLAKHAMYDISTITRLELGQRNPSRTMVDRLTLYLRLNDDEAADLLRSAGFHAAMDIDALAVSLSTKVLNNSAVDQSYREHVRDMVHRLIEDAGRFPVKASRVVRMDQEAA
jgi:transcriptional regulator with XRE-family HTH domain